VRAAATQSTPAPSTNSATPVATASASAPAALQTLLNAFPGKIVSWSVEACVGSYPLEVVACSGGIPAFSGTLSIGVVSVQAEINETRWYGAGPVIGEIQPY